MAISPSTMSRLRCRTRRMSIAIEPVTTPNAAAWWIQVCHFGAPDLVLARKAVDVGARAPDVPAFHDGGPTPGPGQVPGQELAARSAAQDEVVVSFGAHLHSPSQRVGSDQVGRTPVGGSRAPSFPASV